MNIEKMIEDKIQERLSQIFSTDEISDYFKKSFDKHIEAKLKTDFSKMRPEALDKLIKEAEEFSEDLKVGSKLRTKDIDVYKEIKRGK